jgi:uncharacterized membrane protein
MSGEPSGPLSPNSLPRHARALHLIGFQSRRDQHGSPRLTLLLAQRFDALSASGDSLAQLHRGQAIPLAESRPFPSKALSLSKEILMSARSKSALALAAAAAVMFATVSINAAAADEGKVKCEGVNACKGQSACKSARNSCKGQNSCKGAGFLELTKAECDAAHAQAKKKT